MAARARAQRSEMREIGLGPPHLGVFVISPSCLSLDGQALPRFAKRLARGAAAVNQGDLFIGCRRVEARSPIFRPYAVPSAVALRKWNPTRTREYAFSSAAWVKLLNDRSTGVVS